MQLDTRDLVQDRDAAGAVHGVVLPELLDDNVERVADVVKFNWEMVSTEWEVAGVGLEVPVLGPDGRIRRDYQFIES